MKVMVVALAVLAWMAGPLPVRAAAENPKQWSERDRVSYSVGYQIGNDLKSQHKEINPQAIRQGLKDVQANNPAVEREVMQGIINELHESIVTGQKVAEAKSRRQAREEDLDAGRKFLAANGGKEGVVSRPSGLQYKILKAGTGKHPKPDDTVLLNYRSTTIDGREFYSTERKGHPAEVRIKDAIAGLREGLVLMREGGHWQLFIPEGLAYGERGPLADQAVIFDLELISINKPGAAK
jgi:FKBP-type peptidyl-prolyl cis-trans isomerase FklB